MCKDNVNVPEGVTDSWAICCYVFLVALLCEGINVSNGVLMVKVHTTKYAKMHKYNDIPFMLLFLI